MRKLIKKGDLIIVLSLLLLSCLIFVGIKAFSSNGNYVEIEQNGKIIAQLDINEDTSFDIVSGDKTTNTVVIKDSAVTVINADCPDKICQKHAPISKTGESIVCLPNKVFVTIKGDKTEIDGVA